MMSDSSDARDRFADRLDEAPLSVWRFIDVIDGEKGTYDHTQRTPDDPALSGNYGVYGGRGGQHYRDCIDVPPEEFSETDYVWDCECTCGAPVLVDVDVDDGQKFVESGAIEHAPPTLRVKSPHAGIGETATEDDVEGHHFYRVPGTVEEVEGTINDLMTGDSVNPAPDWGEVRVFNQFVVGPGSEINDCDKDWHDCSPSDEGHYQIADDQPIETITPDELVDLLCAGGVYPISDSTAEDDDTTENEPVQDSNDAHETGADPSAVLKANSWIGEYLAIGGADDRSKKDFAVCRTLIENGVSESDARELLNSSVHTKVHERGEGYWNKTWQKAQQKVAESGHDTRRADTDGDGLPKPDPSEFLCQNGCYGYVEQEIPSDGEKREKWTTGTTFQLETLSFIIEDDGATVTVELTVHPARDERSYDVTVPIDVFTEPRKFRQKVATGRTTTYDLGTKFLNKIRRFVGSQDAPIRTPTRHIGLHGDELVTPDGVLTADGWSDDPDTILVDNDTTVPQKWSLGPEDGIEYDVEEVVEILETLPQTRESERFLPVLGWFYAAVFRPKIMEWTGEFNILNITGDTGAGKTATVGALWKLFGMDGEPLSPDGTAFTRLTAFSSSNAIPVWFDEFKPAEMADYQVDMFMSLLRKSTRGGTEPKGNADQSEDQWHLRAPTVVTGEQLVSGPAEERRSIQTVFTSAVTGEETEEYRHFARLTGDAYIDDNGETVYCEELDLSDHARAYYTWVLGRIEDMDTLEREWYRARERISDLLAAEGMNVHPTVRQGFQTILFGCRLYRGFCDALGADADKAGVTDENALDAILATAETGTGHEHISHLDRLLGLAARAAAADYLEESEHYKLVVPRDGTQDDEELRLKLSTSFDAIRRYARDHDVKDGDLLDAARDYRVRIKDAEDDSDSVVVASSVKTYGLNRTCAFSVTIASDHIDEFERSMFDPEDDTTDTDEGDNVSEIADLTPGEYVTIEALASSVLEPRPWLDGEGTFRDESGRIDYTVRGATEETIEQGTMYCIEDVKVTTDDDGMVVLELRGGTTGIEAIGPTATDQHTLAETAETDGGKPATDTENDDMPPADARGAAPDAMSLSVLIDDVADGEMQREDLHNAAKARHDLDEEAIEKAIMYGLRNGILIEPETNLIQTS